MKTLVKDTGKTIQVEWVNGAFEVYTQKPNSQEFQFYCRLHSCRLKPRSRAQAIFDALAEYDNWNYECKLFQSVVRD